MYMVGIWEEYGRALMPAINICLLMCPLAKQPVLPSVIGLNVVNANSKIIFTS